MRVLITGSGGREHVLAWKIKQSSKATQIYCAPGNAGIAQLAECVAIDANDITGLIKFAKEKRVDLTVVGPEAPLVGGIVDEFEAQGLTIFGPKKAAAQLEGSKIFAKEFLNRRNIPTAQAQSFNNIDEARKFISKTQYPLVIKADGLASGKGVLICKDAKEAEKALDKIMAERVFNEAGNKVVIEEYLEGEEASILAVSDGSNYVILEASQDHKKLFDDDQGPNTGGMGAYSPAPIITAELLKKIDARIIEPTIRGMRQEGHPFKGVLYAGLMITEDGPKVLEFNVRFGDPEAQAVLPRLQTDIVDIMIASCEERLGSMKLQWDKRYCVCVVVCSGGYPDKYEIDKEITGIDEANEKKGTVVFHAGTKLQEGKILTSGGRVLGVMSFGDNIEQAIHKVYEAVDKIKFDRCFFRRDIGQKAVNRLISESIPTVRRH